MKALNYLDACFDCEGQIRAETEDEVLKQVAEHARTKHNIQEVTTELAQQLRDLIKDE